MDRFDQRGKDTQYENTTDEGMVIPWQRLSAEALQAVIEDFITRDWTDFGDKRFSLASKVEQVKSQLHQGKAVVVYCPASQSANIVPRNEN